MLDVAAAQGGEEMVDRERQVGLAAAEVDDPERSVRAERRNDVVDELEEAVDLAELVVAALPHRAFGVITPSSTRNGTGSTLLEQVSLPPVVPRGPTTSGSAAAASTVSPRTCQSATAVCSNPWP